MSRPEVTTVSNPNYLQHTAFGWEAGYALGQEERLRVYHYGVIGHGTTPATLALPNGLTISGETSLHIHMGSRDTHATAAVVDLSKNPTEPVDGQHRRLLVRGRSGYFLSDMHVLANTALVIMDGRQVVDYVGLSANTVHTIGRKSGNLGGTALKAATISRKHVSVWTDEKGTLNIQNCDPKFKTVVVACSREYTGIKPDVPRSTARMTA